MNELPGHCCTCGFCLETRRMALEWLEFVPQTRLQKRMKDVVYDIENNNIVNNDKDNVHTEKVFKGGKKIYGNTTKG